VNARTDAEEKFTQISIVSAVIFLSLVPILQFGTKMHY
jgi:hypothetical protein